MNAVVSLLSIEAGPSFPSILSLVVRFSLCRLLVSVRLASIHLGFGVRRIVIDTHVFQGYLNRAKAILSILKSQRTFFRL